MSHKMSKGLIALSLSFLVVGCNQLSGTIQGTLDVAEPLMMTTKNIFGTTQNVEINPGKHAASLSLNLNSVILKVDDGKAIKFNLKNQQLPPGGEFFLSSRVSGQPYDLQGEIDLQENFGQEQTAYESCQKVEMVKVCNNGQCSYIQQHVPGQQWVRFRIKETILKLRADFLKNERPLAELKAGGKNYQKQYIHQGMCL